VIILDTAIVVNSSEENLNKKYKDVKLDFL